MNRRDLLIASGAAAGLLAVGHSASADDGSIDYTRTWNAKDYSDGVVGFYTSVTLWDDVQGAEIFFKMMKANFLDGLISNLEDGGSDIENYGDIKYEITDLIFKNAKGSIILVDAYGFVIYVQESGLPLMQINGMIVQSDQIVHTWFVTGFEDAEQELIDLAEDTMRFNATTKSQLPRMIPDENDMDDFELNEEGFGEEDDF